jgi:hypothetical protein
MTTPLEDSTTPSCQSPSEADDRMGVLPHERQPTLLLPEAAGSMVVSSTGWGAGQHQASAVKLPRSLLSSPVPMAAVAIGARPQGLCDKDPRNTFGWEGGDQLMRNILLAQVMLTTTVTHDGRDKGVFEKGVQMEVARSAVSAIQGLAKRTVDKTRPLFINLSALTVQRQWKSILEKSELWNTSLRDRPGDANGAGVGPASAEVTRLWQTIVDRRAEVQRKNNSVKAKSEE